MNNKAFLTGTGAFALTLLSFWLGACVSEGQMVSSARIWSQGRMGALPTEWSQRGEWLGSESCFECHQEDVDDFPESPHHRLLEIEGGGWGCEACHGPAELHAVADSSAKIDSFERMEADDVANRCSRCHFEDLRQLEAAGLHAGSQNNCSWCHAIHPYSIQAFPTDGPPYTASDCGSCHAEALQVHLTSKHASIADNCSACHKGGENHILSGGAANSIQKLGPLEYQSMCVECHQSEAQLHGWQGSDHMRAGLNCLDCHQLLERQGIPVSSNESEMCGSCHPASAAEFALPSHHPMDESGVNCSSCHNVHGGDGMFAARQMQQACDECHPNYSGPFAFEHEADRFDGCGACHAAHGSANRRMLKVLPVRDMCLQCHPNIPANHNLQGFSVFQNCMDCHTEIHGSHLDRTFFR